MATVSDNLVRYSDSAALGVDVAVMQIADRLIPAGDHVLRVDDQGLVLGQDVYFLGFPFELFTSTGPMNGNRAIPFIKKGIFSAVQVRDQAHVLYIDGHNNPGFSGGPVVFQHAADRDFRIAAVTTGHAEIPSTVMSGQDHTPLTVNSNTGIVISYGVGHALQLIRDRVP